MYAENLELNELHRELGDLIIGIELMELEEKSKDKIKLPLFHAAEIVSEIIESMEAANTIEERLNLL